MKTDHIYSTLWRPVLYTKEASREGSKNFQLSQVKIEPGMAGWEAPTLPLCFAVHFQQGKNLIIRIPERYSVVVVSKLPSSADDATVGSEAMSRHISTNAFAGAPLQHRRPSRVTSSATSPSDRATAFLPARIWRSWSSCRWSTSRACSVTQRRLAEQEGLRRNPRRPF